MNYQIRQISREELAIPVEWAAKEGWNPGLHDIEAFYATDPQGFFMGFLDGEPISSLSAVAYDDTFGFLGFYIVKPEYRDKGYGWQLWQEALKHLPIQNIGLDGVLAQQENYKNSGFQLAYKNIRFEGKGIKDHGKWENISSLSEIPFEQIKNFDHQIFPAKRSAFLTNWIQQPDSLAVGYIKNDELEGYGVVRKCRTGYKVGPLFANSYETADTLFNRMRVFIGENEFIYLDTPETNKNAVELVNKYQMKPMFETARMYTKEQPNVPTGKIYGVTSFELG